MRNIEVPSDYIPYSSFGSPINLNIAKATATTEEEYGRTVRSAFILLITGSGSVSVKMVGSATLTRVIPVRDGQALLGKFLSIEAVSGVTGIVAGWN